MMADSQPVPDATIEDTWIGTDGDVANIWLDCGITIHYETVADPGGSEYDVVRETIWLPDGETHSWRLIPDEPPEQVPADERPDVATAVKQMCAYLRGDDSELVAHRVDDAIAPAQEDR